MIDDRELAGLLIGKRLIDEKRLAEARSLQTRYGGSLYNVAIENGFVDEEQTIQVVGKRLNIPCVSLKDFEAEDDLLELIPPHLAETHKIVPVGIAEDNSLYLAMANPIDVEAMHLVAEATGHDVVALLAGPLDIDRTIERVYEKRHAPSVLGNFFLGPGVAPLPLEGPEDLEGLDELELPSFEGDLMAIPSMDADAVEIDDAFVIESENVEAEDVLALYDAPREEMFAKDRNTLFVAPHGLSDEGRKRLEEVAAVEELEIVQPTRGRTEGFRGWDDDDELDPQSVDRGLFADPSPPSTDPEDKPKRRRLFKKREITTPAKEERGFGHARPLAASNPSPADLPEELPRIGAAVAELPRQGGVKRMTRVSPSSGSRKARLPPIEQTETRDLVLGLVRSLLKQGLIDEQDLLTEIHARDDRARHDGD